MGNMYYNLESLNKEQLLPTLDTEGIVVVTAGAGSGKTRVLTHRIFHLILDKTVAPDNILAITFTNKATNELKERLSSINVAGSVWVSTFHSMCAKILRFNINLLGYTSSFSIYGDSESDRVIKRILEKEETKRLV
jgi:DNA helicase-2/ATP-dependent DNA helicase PcrA